MFEIFAFVYFMFLILFAFSMIIHKKQGEINKIHQDLLENIYKRLKFLEQKQTEMRINICLQNRRIDKIFLEKNLENTEIEKKFALEIEKFRSNFEKITKAQACRIGIIERKIGISKKMELPNSENIFK